MVIAFNSGCFSSSTLVGTKFMSSLDLFLDFFLAFFLAFFFFFFIDVSSSSESTISMTSGPRSCLILSKISSHLRFLADPCILARSLGSFSMPQRMSATRAAFSISLLSSYPDSAVSNHATMSSSVEVIVMTFLGRG